jgi:hypothetical protein
MDLSQKVASDTLNVLLVTGYAVLAFGFNEPPGSSNEGAYFTLSM